MIYRLLQNHEWPRLVEYFERRGRIESLPTPDTAIAAIAEHEGQIVGVLLQQLMWHREPLMLDRPQVRFDRLNSILNEAFAAYPGSVYYAVADQQGVVDMAKAVGMEPLQGVLLRGTN